MSAIEVFRFPATGQNIRMVLRNDEPWFVGRDACAVLDIAKPENSIALLDEDEKDTHTVGTPGGPQVVTVISESGLYSLILRSRKPEAKAFKRWITHEVLPAIRKTGRYEAAKVSPRELALLVIEEADRADRAEAKVLELEPAASAWNVLGSTDADYSVREAAFILNRDPAIQIGQNRLFNLLRQWDLIDRKDIPYAAHERHVRLRPQTRPDWETGERIPAKPQVRVTVEGLRYLHKRMGGAAPLSLETEEAA